MFTVQIKRVYEEADPTDGYRVLVDRLWPRGMKKERLAFDEWNKGLAPSTEARKAFGHKRENFETFKARYQMELDQSEAAHDFVAKALANGTRKITLLYAAKDPQINHAIILAAWLEAEGKEQEAAR